MPELKPSDSLTVSPAGVEPSPVVDRELAWSRLVTLACIVLAGVAVATAFHHVHATVLRHGYPQSTFVFDPFYRYSDLVDSWVQARSPNPFFDHHTPAVATYFPLMYGLLALVGGLTREGLVIAYLVLTYLAVGLVVGAWLWSQRQRWRGDPRWPAVVALSLALALVSYPLLFAVDRGNIDPLLMALLAGSLMLLDRDRPMAGALVLAVAAALKGYPLVAFALWLRRGRFVAAVTGVVVAGLLVVLPGLMFEGGIARTLEGLRLGMSVFRDGYVLGGASAHFSSDWINAVRLLTREAGVALDMATVVRVYQVVAMLLASVLALHAVFVARPGGRALLALVVVMLTFPNVTNDYKLVLLLPAALAWLSEPSAGQWRDRLFAVAVGLLLIPKHYALFPHTDASISCALNPLLVTSLLAVLWPTSDEVARGRATLEAARARLRLLVGTRSRVAGSGDPR